MNHKVSTIEIFPNELLIETFKYTSCNDLFNIFYRLNFRFYSLINSLQRLHLLLEEDWDHKQSIIPSFASHITTLTIKHDEFVDFSYFSNIRSLKLCMPTAQQCNAILPHVLPNLEHLSISNLYFSDNTEQLCRLIFSSSFSFLKTCRIDRMTLPNFDSYSSLSLNQLTISPCTWKTNIFKQIFSACSNLTYLRIIYRRNISFQFNPNFIPVHISIRRLSLHLYTIAEEWYNQIDGILSMVPHLDTFIIIIDRKEINIDFSFFSSFARMLIQHVPRIIHFKAKIPVHTLSLPNLDTIRYLHRLFTQVKFQANINENSNSHLIILSEK